MSQPAASSRSAVVIFAHADPFRTSYVADVLAGRGIAAVGPLDAASAIAAVGNGELAPPHPALLVDTDDTRDRLSLMAALRERDVPFLILTDDLPELPPDEPALRYPYAAYQVADWLISVVGK